MADEEWIVGDKAIAGYIDEQTGTGPRPATVLRWRVRETHPRKIPWRRWGRSVAVSRRDLDAWIAERWDLTGS